MKKIYRIITAAFVAAVALSSCTIEIIGTDGPGRDIDTPRTIAVSFAPQSKTALGQDGVTPEFEPGDQILVSNDKYCETLSIKFDHNGGASFTTELDGALIAVYPATAAKLNGSQIEGVLVPSSQTGRFKDANIAMAKIKEGANLAVFENQTAILKFYVDKSIGVMGIGIFSNEDNICDGYIDEEGNVTESEPVGDDEKPVIYTKQITVEKELEPEANYYQPNFIPLNQLTDDPQGRVCYVAIRPTTGTQTYNLRIVSRTTTQTANNGLLYKSQQAIGQVQREFSNVSLPANTLANVFIPYYIPVNVGTDTEPEYQYWSYCNVGAFLPEEYGYYFTWGNTQGYVPKNYEEDEDDVEWFLPSGEPAPAGGFTNDNYSQTTGSTLTGNITAENDAATTSWGGKWRMPTKSEFVALVAGTTWTASGCEEIYGKRGKYFVGYGGETKVFLPTTGNVYADEFQYISHEAHYWSSDLSTEGQNQAYGLYYWDTPSISSTLRYHGCPIRPIYGDPLPEENGLKVDKYDQGSTL